jgi:glycosyltransferase involved in cell wall biosynthesis
MGNINNDPPQKLLFVGNTAWSMYNFRKGILKYLLQNGFHVMVAAPEDEYAEKLEALGIEFIPLRKLEAKGMNPVREYFFYRELIKLYRDHQPALVFHYTIKPNIYGTMAAASLNIPSIAITTGLGYTFTHKGIASVAARMLYRYSLAKAREVWFLNEDDRQVFIDTRIIPSSKSFLLPGEGIDTEHFSPENGQPYAQDENIKPLRFALIARMILDKGVAEFVEASRILRKKGLEFESVLIGFMDVLNPSSISKDQMDRWEKEGVVQYLGVTSDIIPFLAAADCVVLPSFYREGIPRTLLEGASMSKIVITTDNVGCREVVDDGITGFLCKVKDPEDLAHKMEHVLRLLPAQRHEMGQKGREKMIRTFDERIINNIYNSKIRLILGNC